MRSMFAVVARELREKYGETLQSMAEEFGVSFQYLSLLETCKGKSLRRITPIHKPNQNPPLKRVRYAAGWPLPITY